MKDKRSQNRIPAAVEVSLTTDHDFYAGTTGDVGYGGVFVVTETPPPPGSEVRLAIHLPDGGTVHASGCVRWVRTPDLAAAELPAGCGIAWQALDRRSLVAVRQKHEQQSPQRAA
jgi:uncharacterized protein (TIGR02266 family)